MPLFTSPQKLPPPTPANTQKTATSSVVGPLTIGLFDHGTGYKVSTSLFEHLRAPLDDLSKQLSRCGCYQIEIIEKDEIVHVSFGLATLDIYEISKGNPKAFWSFHLMGFLHALSKRLPAAEVAEAMTRWGKLAKNAEPAILLMALRAAKILKRYEAIELEGLDCGVHLNVDLDREAVVKLWTAPGDIVAALDTAVRGIRSAYKDARAKATTR